MGNGVSHAANEEGEAGTLDSFGDLTEVNTNVVLEHLLEVLTSSPTFPQGFGLPSKPSPSSLDPT